MTETLKPCPFCGGVDTLDAFPDLDGWAAGCAYGCRILFRRKSQKGAIEAWNTRTTGSDKYVLILPAKEPTK